MLNRKIVLQGKSRNLIIWRKTEIKIKNKKLKNSNSNSNQQQKKKKNHHINIEYQWGFFELVLNNFHNSSPWSKSYKQNLENPQYFV